MKFYKGFTWRSTGFYLDLIYFYRAYPCGSPIAAGRGGFAGSRRRRRRAQALGYKKKMAARRLSAPRGCRERQEHDGLYLYHRG